MHDYKNAFKNLKKFLSTAWLFKNHEMELKAFEKLSLYFYYIGE